MTGGVTSAALPPKPARKIHVIAPPPAQAWGKLCACLVQIADQDRQGANYDGAPPGFWASEAALSEILTFLQCCDELMQAGAIAPVFRLRAALRDLQEGRQPDLTKPRSRGGRPGTDHCTATIIGFAARAMEELIQSGASVEAAADKVCKCVRKGRASGYRAVTATKIKNWRNRCREGDGADIAPGALRHYREPLPPGMGDTPALRAKNLLLVLSEAANQGL